MVAVPGVADVNETVACAEAFDTAPTMPGAPGFTWVTVTVVVAEPVFCAASVALHVTVVEPIGNVEPDAGVHVTVSLAPSTVSVALSPEKVAGPPLASTGGTLTGAGAVTVGGVVSTTVTRKESVASLPASSVYVHVTVVGPIANFVPDSGVHSGVTGPSTRSVADTV